MPKFKMLILLLTVAHFTEIYNRDTVHACISTVGWRESSLELTLNEIIPQVDNVFVFLQGYEKIPTFLNHEKITILEGKDYPEALSLGSSAKFFWADKIKGYYITIDDDILYPPNYVEYCIEKIEEYERKAIIGFHGSLFDNSCPLKRKLFHYAFDLENDTNVHMLGTGVMAYHTDTIEISMRDFTTKNQDDLWIAVKSQKLKIPMVCVNHKKDFIITITNFANDERSIFVKNPNHQMAMAESFVPWEIN